MVFPCGCGIVGFSEESRVELIAALIAVVALAAINKWNERRLANRILKSMDKVMGRED